MRKLHRTEEEIELDTAVGEKLQKKLEDLGVPPCCICVVVDRLNPATSSISIGGYETIFRPDKETGAVTFLLFSDQLGPMEGKLKVPKKGYCQYTVANIDELGPIEYYFRWLSQKASHDADAIRRFIQSPGSKLANSLKEEDKKQ